MKNFMADGSAMVIGRIGHPVIGSQSDRFSCVELYEKYGV
jgi:hypothetical protein